MAAAGSPGTSWEAPRKKKLPAKEPSDNMVAPPIVKDNRERNRKILKHVIAPALFAAGFVLFALFIVPFIQGFLAVAQYFSNEALRSVALRDTVNSGIPALIGALMAYGGYRLYIASRESKSDAFPLKPSTPGQVLKPGE
jgi:hypothetical protein